MFKLILFQELQVIDWESNKLNDTARADQIH